MLSILLNEQCSKWKHLEHLVPDDAAFEEAKKQILNMAWWDKVKLAEAELPARPEIYHLNPIVSVVQIDLISRFIIPKQRVSNGIDPRLKDLKEGELVWFGLPSKADGYYTKKGAIAEKHLTLEFKIKLIKICNDLNINPNYLMACIALETGYTFSPSIVNGIGATGLIQFTKSTAIDVLFTTTDMLEKLSAIEQLDYVKMFLLKNKVRKAKTLSDLYLCIFTPAAVGKPEDAILYTKNSKGYKNNSSLDANKDLKLTKKFLVK